MYQAWREQINIVPPSRTLWVGIWDNLTRKENEKD